MFGHQVAFLSITQKLSDNSSESDVFQGKPDSYKKDPANDVFTPINGKGNGVWGLKTFSADLDNELTTVLYTSNSTEGQQKRIYTTIYERNSKNRQLSLDHYGYDCQVCGFNFETKYGEIGKSFLEVHHNVPLFSLNQKITIDPIRDLTPVCPNCHRMIHRNKQNILTIDDLKQRLQ